MSIWGWSRLGDGVGVEQMSEVEQRWWRSGADVVAEQGGGGAGVVAEQGGGGGDVVAGGGGARVLGQMNVLKREKRSAEVRRLVDKSAWGRGEADVFGLQIFKKTNKLPEPYVCAPLRDADISAQKSFWPKNKHHLKHLAPSNF